ncbi:hypothetical protein MUP65_00425, partial [Patescibacteria group bacterium]|nr:hypothetical protein [Patescibacteria group bacterium]
MSLRRWFFQTNLKRTKKKLMLRLAVFSLAVWLVSDFSKTIFAACTSDCNSVEECARLIEECQVEIEARTGAHEKNKADLQALERSLANTESLLQKAEGEIEQVAEEITVREESLVDKQEVFNNHVRSHYIRSIRFPSLAIFLSASKLGLVTRQFTYQQAVTDNDKQIIQTISENLNQLNKDQTELEEHQSWLSSVKKTVASQTASMKTEIAKVEDFFSQVESKIAQLSAKQEEILAQKQGTFQTTVGEVPLADDPASRPDYNPGFSPAFAAFSFGAPHYKGMSQYGAYGRARAGQGVEEILRAYYGQGIEIRKDYPTNIQITVEGYGTVDIETYTQRIYEVPNSWGDQGGMEALRAQAVAARSYALARTNNGASSICATESCQVYKPVNKGGNWERAVNETRGWVLIAGGQPFSAWYASTSGGYQESYVHNGHATPGFWDTPSGRSGWTSQAWEKQAESPWFYKAWYRTRSGDACGRDHPWLTAEEMADILNAWVVLIEYGQSDDRVLPLGGCWGGSPYSLEELRNRAAQLGVGYTRVTGVGVTYSDGGYTANVHFETDQGGLDISGSEFKKAFNLRA